MPKTTLDIADLPTSYYKKWTEEDKEHRDYEDKNIGKPSLIHLIVESNHNWAQDHIDSEVDFAFLFSAANLDYKAIASIGGMCNQRWKVAVLKVFHKNSFPTSSIIHELGHLLGMQHDHEGGKYNTKTDPTDSTKKCGHYIMGYLHPRKMDYSNCSKSDYKDWLSQQKLECIKNKAKTAEGT